MGPVRAWLRRAGRAGLARFHSDTVPLSPPAAKILPSGLNAIESTVKAKLVKGWPSSVGRAGLRQVPQPHLATAADGQYVLVRAERESVPAVPGTGRELAERGWMGGVDQVPQPDAAGGAGRGQDLPVRAERHRSDGIHGTGRGWPRRTGLAGSARLHSQTLSSSLPTAQDLPIRAERHRINGSRRTCQATGQRCRCGIKQPCLAVRRGADLVGGDIELGGDRRVGGNQLPSHQGGTGLRVPDRVARSQCCADRRR